MNLKILVDVTVLKMKSITKILKQEDRFGEKMVNDSACLGQVECRYLVTSVGDAN